MTNRKQTASADTRQVREGAARVAIVGGGAAGLTAAFELSRPEQRGRFEITVYQMGFRLGGKGASGRGVGGRIEEHGLHLWLGFYENAFRLMRECYAELGRDRLRCPIASWQDAFKPAPWVAVTDQTPSGAWEPWLARFPAGDGLPGDATDVSAALSTRHYLTKAVALVIELLRSAEVQARGSAPTRAGCEAEQGPSSLERVIEAAEWLLRHGQLATAAGLLEAMQLLQRSLAPLPADVGAPIELVQRLLEAVSQAARRQLAMIVSGDPSLRRTWQVIDLILAVVRGSIAHGLLFHPQGFDAIDDYDWREWLALHGASREALDSGFMRGIYDLAFAYRDGDARQPALSAAAALRGALRMFFSYRGSLFWRMSAGMGDVVFAPLYQVLKQRGVRFEFFHRLEDIQLSDRSAPDPHVTALRFALQAELKEGGEYRPLIEVHGLPSWPARADDDQLVDGARLEREQWLFESPWERRIARERVLEVGRDFDLVVLALGGGAIPMVSQQLIARSPKWQRMAEHLNSVATQALQLWIKEDMAALGWNRPGVNLSGWVEPFDTWADMTHLIPAEDAREPVKAIAYFCSPLPDPELPARAREEALHAQQSRRVRDNAVHLLEREIKALWPGACTRAGDFRWELLAVEQRELAQREASARIDSQFWTANVRPSDRYVLTLPGTQKYRLSPLDMSFDNLTVAGDWTASGLNTGCVESAVMSGRLAASALSGAPALEDIVGYDHP